MPDAGAAAGPLVARDEDAERERTQPLWIFRNLFRPGRSPVVDVAAVALVVVSVVPVYPTDRLCGDSAGAVT